MAWWINIAEEVARGVKSFGLSDPNAVLLAMQRYLSEHGEACAEGRWQHCPEKYFVYTHLFVEGGRLNALEFLVDDTSRTVGVLRVVWVEFHPGGPFP